MSASLVSDSTCLKRFTFPGVASLPGPPIPRLPAPSVFACVRPESGFQRCLPHLQWKDAMCGVGPWLQSVCFLLCLWFAELSCLLLCFLSLCLFLLPASSLLRWWRDWVVCCLTLGFLRVLAVLICLHFGISLASWLLLLCIVVLISSLPLSLWCLLLRWLSLIHPCRLQGVGLTFRSRV